MTVWIVKFFSTIRWGLGIFLVCLFALLVVRLVQPGKEIIYRSEVSFGFVTGANEEGVDLFLCLAGAAAALQLLLKGLGAILCYDSGP